MAGDAEGAKHLVTIEVEGLADDEQARRVAKTIAESALVKTAIFGADPNWGRIVSAAGYAGVPFEENELSLWLGDLPLYRDGRAAAVRRGHGVGLPEAKSRSVAAAQIRPGHGPLHVLDLRSDAGVRAA